MKFLTSLVIVFGIIISSPIYGKDNKYIEVPIYNPLVDIIAKISDQKFQIVICANVRVFASQVNFGSTDTICVFSASGKNKLVLCGVQFLKTIHTTACFNKELTQDEAIIFINWLREQNASSERDIQIIAPHWIIDTAWSISEGPEIARILEEKLKQFQTYSSSSEFIN